MATECYFKIQFFLLLVWLMGESSLSIDDF